MPSSVPTKLYIHESKIQQNGNSYASYISDSPETDTSNFRDVDFSDYEDVHSYILNQMTTFYNTFKPNPTLRDANQKTMKQRYLDIFSIQIGFHGILQSVSQSYLGTDAVTLLNNNTKLKSLRSKLDNDINNVYGHDGSASRDNKLKVDSTIYSSVLWTVLAVFLIYYVFIYMQ